MSFAGGMIGVMLFWYAVSPKAFGRHLAECIASYRTALEKRDT